jgi:hypothetical protein
MHDALRIQDKIMNVESSFQMGYGVAYFDMVDNELIPSQTMQLDFQPMSTGSETEGISHIFLTTSFWEHSEPEISNPANSGTSLKTTNSDEMVDNTANSSELVVFNEVPESAGKTTNSDEMVDNTANSFAHFFSNVIIDQLDTTSLFYPSKWHRKTHLYKIYSIFSVSRDDTNTMVIQNWVDIDLYNHEATFSDQA